MKAHLCSLHLKLWKVGSLVRMHIVHTLNTFWGGEITFHCAKAVSLSVFCRISKTVYSINSILNAMKCSISMAWLLSYYIINVHSLNLKEPRLCGNAEKQLQKQMMHKGMCRHDMQVFIFASRARARLWHSVRSTTCCSSHIRQSESKWFHLGRTDLDLCMYPAHINKWILIGITLQKNELTNVTSHAPLECSTLGGTEMSPLLAEIDIDTIHPRNVVKWEVDCRLRLAAVERRC